MRSYKLTPEVQKKLLDAIGAGNYLTVAARYAGICPRTLHYWLKRGRQSRRGIFRELYDAVTRTEAMPEVRAVAMLSKLIEEQNLSGLIKFLERKYPRRWGTPAMRVRARAPRRAKPADPSHAAPPPPNATDADRSPPAPRYRDPTLADPERAARILEALREIGYGRPAPSADREPRGDP